MLAHYDEGYSCDETAITGQCGSGVGFEWGSYARGGGEGKLLMSPYPAVYEFTSQLMSFCPAAHEPAQELSGSARDSRTRLPPNS